VGKVAWQSFKTVTKTFWGNQKAENYGEVVSDF
jgi:hypothetical protein